MTRPDPAREHALVTSSSSEVLKLLQAIDQASIAAPVADQGADYGPAQLARVDEAMDDLRAISDSPFYRELPQDAQTFVEYSNATGVVLQFSEWGNLVCVRHLQASGDSPDSIEADLGLIAQSPEILTGHGFVPVRYEDLQSPYTGTLYGAEYHAANDHDWFWRFFSHH